MKAGVMKKGRPETIGSPNANSGRSYSFYVIKEMKMKRRTKIFALTAGLILAFTTVFAFAAVGAQQITVNYNNIKLVIDGQTVTPRDANGNVVEPFIYNGTTYLPVRAVGEALGKEVSWDGATATVNIGAPGTIPAPAPSQTTTDTVGAWLRDMEPVDYSPAKSSNGWARNNWSVVKKDNEGGTYEHGGIYAGDGATFFGNLDHEHSVTYELNANYKKFKGTIALSYESRDAERSYCIQFYGDGNLLYQSPIVTGGISPLIFDIDVSGVRQLKIVRVADGVGQVGIVNAAFYY